MDKDEMKNRISMALKDPILQQGFEIICKENAELRRNEFNARSCLELQQSQDRAILNYMGEQLTKAKEIIKTMLGFMQTFGYSPSMDKFITEAEQFLKGDGCPDVMCEDCTKEDCGTRQLGLVGKVK